MSSSEAKCPECNGSRGVRRLLHDTDPPHECADPFHDQPDMVEVPTDPPHVANMPEKAPAAGSREVKLTPPLCPHCEAPGTVVGQMAIIRGIHVMMISCGKCRKMISAFQALQMQPVELPGGTN